MGFPQWIPMQDCVSMLVLIKGLISESSWKRESGEINLKTPSHLQLPGSSFCELTHCD